MTMIKKAAKRLKKIFAGLTVTAILSSGAASAEQVKLTLDEAIALALKNNRAIEQSAADREAAKWSLSAVRRNTGLMVTWGASLKHIGGRFYRSRRENHDFVKYAASTGKTDQNGNKFNPKVFPSYDNEMTNSFSLRMNVYTGGRLENQQEAAKYGLNAADMRLENTRQQVKFQTAAAYYQVLERASYVEVQQESVRLLEEHLRTVEIQYEVGTVAKSDMLATNVQLANVRQNLNTARGNYLTAVAQLNNLMGLSVDTEVVTSATKNFEPWVLTESECLQYSYEHRPDGIAAMYDVQQAEAARKSAKAGYRPNLAVVAQGSFSGEGNFTADHAQEQWSFGLEMQWNIFDNGITSAQVHSAEAQKKRYESQARQQVETISLDVHNAYVNLQTAAKNIEVTSEAVAKAEEEFEIAQIRYVEGVDTNLNVMNAQEKVVETKNNYYRALYNYNTSRAQLEKAMGIPVTIDPQKYVSLVKSGQSSTKSLKGSQVEKAENEPNKSKPFDK